LKGESFTSTAEVMNIDGLKKNSNHESDREMVNMMEALIKEVTEDIEQFRLHEGAQRLYQFTWHEFADKYIEDVKGRLDESAYQTLQSSFVLLLTLLHPFMPFITEEIYQKLSVTGKKESMMIASWPILVNDPEVTPHK
ncbi:MAG: class I tRNA ligase family protein, partial [bacterium]|nr:class I tRNA ligase family protein [bacterium]